MRRHEITAGLAVTAASLLLCACGGKTDAGAPAAEVPQVTVLTLRLQPVVLRRELPGRTSAFLVAEVRPQVGGIVRRRRFTEGADVRAGEVLYDLDDSLYRAAADSALAGLKKAEAGLLAARLNAARAAELVQADAVSVQDNESAVAALGQAEAEVAAAHAAVASSTVNLAYAHIVAPISGRIGKSTVTQGALVTAGQAAPLATIQQLDPMYVEVNQASTEWLALKAQIDAGTLRADRTRSAARIWLENGAAYPQPAVFQFADVSVDPGTGNFLLRARVPNPQLVLLPGMYVRAELSEGTLQDALLVPQRGITRDPKGTASALIVGNDGKVAAREVRVTRTVGEDWLVASGLNAGERVIIEGVQKVQPGMAVKAFEAAPEPPPAAPPAPTPR